MTVGKQTLLFVACAFCAAPAFAADSIEVPDPAPALRSGYVHFGFSVVKQADEGSLFVAGFPVAGADFETELGMTASVEVGAFLRDGFAVSVSGMWPVTTGNVAAGTLAGLGNLGNETVGFYSATAHYHFAKDELVSPYVGGGLGYMHVFGTEGVLISNMDVNSAFGAVLQAGVDVGITDNVGAFLDVKKYFIPTLATGTIGGAPISAQTKVDPWVVTAGLSLRD